MMYPDKLVETQEVSEPRGTCAIAHSLEEKWDDVREI